MSNLSRVILKVEIKRIYNEGTITTGEDWFNISSNRMNRRRRTDCISICGICQNSKYTEVGRPCEIRIICPEPNTKDLETFRELNQELLDDIFGKIDFAKLLYNPVKKLDHLLSEVERTTDKFQRSCGQISISEEEKHAKGIRDFSDETISKLATFQFDMIDMCEGKILRIIDINYVEVAIHVSLCDLFSQRLVDSETVKFNGFLTGDIDPGIRMLVVMKMRFFASEGVNKKDRNHPEAIEVLWSEIEKNNGYFLVKTVPRTSSKDLHNTPHAMFYYHSIGESAENNLNNFLSRNASNLTHIRPHRGKEYLTSKSPQ